MKVYIELQEASEMEKVAGNLRDKLLIRLLFRLGGRVSEVLGMNDTLSMPILFKACRQVADASMVPMRRASLKRLTAGWKAAGVRGKHGA